MRPHSLSLTVSTSHHPGLSVSKASLHSTYLHPYRNRNGKWSLILLVHLKSCGLALSRLHQIKSLCLKDLDTPPVPERSLDVNARKIQMAVRAPWLSPPDTAINAQAASTVSKEQSG